MERPKLEVADVFRQYGEVYRDKHGASMSTAQRRVIWNSAISAAMSATLTTLVLWGVFSNGEFGLGIHAGLAFSTDWAER
jgi:hypothetical protein